ncbi:MAG TPA: helix-turn-helix transcriptional regulator [Conexibacter sp.]|jgi:transcriptional regulator with XRE-family HTH domain
MRDPSPELRSLARVLKRQRRALDLTQEALADASGVSAKHIGEIERGNKDPRFTTVMRLVSDGLGTPAEEFFSEVEDGRGEPR